MPVKKPSGKKVLQKPTKRRPPSLKLNDDISSLATGMMGPHPTDIPLNTKPRKTRVPARTRFGNKYDWDAARDMFMTANPSITLKQLGLRTGIPYQQIRLRSMKERWMALRQQEQTAVLKENRKNFLMKMAGEAISFDENSIDVAKLGQGIITARLIEISKLLQAAGDTTDLTIEKLKAGIPLQKGDLYSIINYKELVSLAQAADLFQKIGRTALGSEVTDATFLADAQDDNLEQVVSIGGELTKDDPARLAAFLEALEAAGLTQIDLLPPADEEDSEQIQVIEGALVPDAAVQKQIEASVVSTETTDEESAS